MGQGHEFNVRQVRGKGFQIIPLSTRSSRVYWVSIGMTLGLTASNLAYHFTRSIAMGAAISAGWLIVNMLGQITYLVIVHRRDKAMLAEMGMSEKEALAMMDKIIAEGDKHLAELKRDIISRIEALGPKDEQEDKGGGANDRD
jgi:hypothetical protein